MEKICTKCKTKRDFKEFYANKKTKDGKASWCKYCCCNLTKEYRMNNESYRFKGQRDDVKEYQRIYREENREAKAKNDKEYAIKNADKIKAYSKIWRQENRDKLLQDKKEYHHNNVERFRPQKKRILS